MMNGGAIASWHHLAGTGGGDRLHCTCYTTQVARHQPVLLQIPETVNASASMVDEIIGGLGDSDEHTYTVPVLHSHCLSASSLQLHLPVHPAPSPHSRIDGLHVFIVPFPSLSPSLYTHLHFP